MIHSVKIFILCLIVTTGVSCAEHDDEVSLAKKARELLEYGKAGFVEKNVCYPLKKRFKWMKQKYTCVRELKSLDVLLAVKSKDENFFKLVEVVGSGTKLCVSKTEGFKTTCFVDGNEQTNGVNTHFTIEYPPNRYKVYGIRRVVNDPIKRKEVVYTPYSTSLDLPMVRKAGSNYIKSVIDKAFEDLRTKGVRSLVNPNQLVVDRVPRETVYKLAVNEHIDEGRYLKENIEDLANEVLTIYGLNQEISYNFSKSVSMAHGMFQIIPSTYKYIWKIYPNADVDPDFDIGTNNHVNAAKVATLLVDHDVGLLPEYLRLKLFENPKLYDDYVASSYNGGSKRPKEILLRGDDIVENNSNTENSRYVSKMRNLGQIKFP